MQSTSWYASTQNVLTLAVGAASTAEDKDLFSCMPCYGISQYVLHERLHLNVLKDRMKEAVNVR